MSFDHESHDGDHHIPGDDESRSLGSSRRELRSLIFHILYVAESLDYTDSIDAIVDNLNRGFGVSIEPESEVAITAQAIVAERELLDAVYQPLLQNWHIDRVSVCTKLVLRYAIWELRNTDTDPRIVINEAIELAKCFAEQDAFKFVNGILDQIVKGLPTASAAQPEEADE